MAPSDRSALVLGAIFGSSGLALLVYILAGVSLGLTLLLVMAAATAGGLLARRRLPPERRALLARRIAAGTAGGAAGLLAYDGTRWLLVQAGHFKLKPFDVFYSFGQAMFGQAILGPGHPAWLLWTAGIAFHLLNGIGFAVAYAVWLGERGWLAGIAFAMGLQAVMVAVYPSWL